MLRAFIIATGLGVGLIGAPSVLAGGWSVTVLDQVLMEPVAGATHRVGFTVLQHGTRPADGLRTSIAIQATGSGQSLEFPAHADGASGHYLAEVRFPSSGEWTWEVRQDWFGPQSLGSVTVVGSSALPPSVPSAGQDLRVALDSAVHAGGSRLPLVVIVLSSLLMLGAALRGGPPAFLTARRGSTKLP